MDINETPPNGEIDPSDTSILNGNMATDFEDCARLEAMGYKQV